jgi:predicted dehydrogenase
MPVRIGVVGVGKFGVNHLRAFRQAGWDGRAQLVAAADTDERRLEEARQEFAVKGYSDYRVMIEKEKLDAVTIVTPDHLHREIALFALDAAKHILVEKPLDVTVQGCLDILEKGRQAGRLVQVDFHKRYDPYHLELERLVQAGELGDIEYGYVHMEDRLEVPRDWFPHWAPRSSPNWFLGVHFYDLVRWVLKSDGKRVFATGRKAKLTSLGVDTWDSIHAHVEFENGAQVTFHSSWILPDRFEAIVNQGLRLVGTEGLIEIDSQSRGAEMASAKRGQATLNMGFLREYRDRKGRTNWAGYGIESILDFADNVNHLLEGGKLEDLGGRYPSAEDGLEVTRIASAVEESIASGAPVKIQR